LTQPFDIENFASLPFDTEGI